MSSHKRAENAEMWFSDSLVSINTLYKKGEIDSMELKQKTNKLEKEKEKMTTLNDTYTNDNSKCFFHDTGSNAHLSNDKSVFIPGSLKACKVHICGIHDDDSVEPMYATQCGDVLYKIDENTDVTLKNVLYVEHASLTNAVEPTVLVSTIKFVRECGVGVHFVAGGKRADFIMKDKVFCSVDLIGEFLLHKVERKIDINKHNHNTTRDKLEHHRKINSINSTYVKNKHKKLVTKEKTKKNIREKKLRERENKIIYRKKAIDKKKTADNSTGRKLSVAEKEKLFAKLHARMHFGKTQPIIRALKRAYGDNSVYNDDNPCDACMWAKARIKPCPKTSTRKAKRVGERLP